MEPAMEGECSIHALQFSGIFAAGLAPSNAASVKVTTTDGRSLEASIYVLPSSTSDFEAFGVVMPAPAPSSPSSHTTRTARCPCRAASYVRGCLGDCQGNRVFCTGWERLARGNAAGVPD